MDIRDVENLRDNVLWLGQRMPGFMQRWQASKPNCEYNTGLIKEICYKPGILGIEVFDPVIKWLSDYILNREGSLKIVNVDDFLKAGLYRIFRFVTVADFFAQNTQYFVPYQALDQNKLSEYRTYLKSQKDYQEFINLLLGKLIGCNDKLHFIFKKLLKTVDKLPEDLQKMQAYLENKCVSLRIQALEKK